MRRRKGVGVDWRCCRGRAHALHPKLNQARYEDSWSARARVALRCRLLYLIAGLRFENQSVDVENLLNLLSSQTGMTTSAEHVTKGTHRVIKESKSKMKQTFQ